MSHIVIKYAAQANCRRESKRVGEWESASHWERCLRCRFSSFRSVSFCCAFRKRIQFQFSFLFFFFFSIFSFSCDSSALACRAAAEPSRAEQELSAALRGYLAGYALIETDLSSDSVKEREKQAENSLNTRYQWPQSVFKRNKNKTQRCRPPAHTQNN